MPFASGVAVWLSDPDAGIDKCMIAWCEFMAGIGTVNAYMPDYTNNGGVLEFTGPLNDIVVHAMQVVPTNMPATPIRLFVCFSGAPYGTFTHPPGWPTQPQ